MMQMTTEPVRQASDVQTLAPWLRLMLTDGLGGESARKLLGRFGMPENIFQGSRAELASLVGARVAAALTMPISSIKQAAIDASLTWAEQPGHCILTLADAAYPAELLNIPDPPVMLYLRGHHHLLATPGLAVVGSRNATMQGVSHAGQFSEQVSRAGITVVSGLALGIDAAAHEGGLRGSGSTIAVIGTGIDLDYPLRNRKLAQRIAEEGCIVSEYPLGTPPLPGNFPRRNRLISGLSRAVLVVEAAAKSGSLITARMAAEQGRDVFAIPGSIHSPLAKGCHQLIRQGAKLVETVQDILEEMPSFPTPQRVATSACAPDRDEKSASHGAQHRFVIQAMGHDPVSLDMLAMRCKLAAAELGDVLLALELAGDVEVLPGGLYRRIHGAN